MVPPQAWIVLGSFISAQAVPYNLRTVAVRGPAANLHDGETTSIGCRLLSMMGVSDGGTIIFIRNDEHEHGLLCNSWNMHRGVTTMSSTLPVFEDFLVDVVQELKRINKLDVYRKTLNFVVVCNKTAIQEILQKVSTVDAMNGTSSLLRHFSKWLFLQNSSWNCNINETVPYNTTLDNVALAVFDDSSHAYSSIPSVDIATLLWKPGSQRQWSRLGQLTDELSSDTNFDLFPNTKYGLNMRQLKVGVLEWIHYCRKRSTPHGQEYTHVCRDIMDGLSQALNFSYVFVEPEDGLWGGVLANSTWTGILGMVARNEIDFVAIPYGMTVSRAEVMSFSSALMSTPYQVMYKKRMDDRGNWMALVACFKWEVYLCGLVTLVWCAGLFTVLEQREGILKHWNSSRTAQDIMLMLLVPLHQGGSRTPEKISSRLMYTFWWIFCIIVTAVYTGNLIAFVTVIKEKIPFKTIEELAKDNSFGILIQRGSYAEEILKVTNDHCMQMIWRKVLDSRKRQLNVGSSASELELHSSLLQSGQYVYIDTSVTLDSVNDGHMRKMRRNFQDLSVYLPFPKESPLTEFVSKELTVLHETGLIDGWMLKWSHTTTPQYVTDVEPRVQLQLSDLSSALAVCGTVMFVGMLVLVAERIVRN